MNSVFVQISEQAAVTPIAMQILQTLWLLLVYMFYIGSVSIATAFLAFYMFESELLECVNFIIGGIILGLCSITLNYELIRINIKDKS